MNKKDYIVPQRIIACEKIEDEHILLKNKERMAAFHPKSFCKLAPGGWVLLDFGMEYNGGLQLIIGDMMGKKNAKVRVRFGESAMECMADLGEKGATNDHSVRDAVLYAPWVGILEYGHTGYRFIRVDNADDVTISVIQIYGTYEHSGKHISGEFSCSDSKLNAIWDTGVRTLYLNNNDLITDGIKRDRLVWIGDMHPETIGILRLFGYDESICRSLDYIKNITSPDQWMNDIPSYSMWWIIIHKDLFEYSGDLEYLRAQLEYMRVLVHVLGNYVCEDGSDTIPFKFIDWPSSKDAVAQACGVHSLMMAAMVAAEKIFRLFGEDTAEYCASIIRKLRCFSPDHNGNKQAAALYVFSGEGNAKKLNDELFSREPLKGLSAFLSYYVFRARAEAGDMTGALQAIRRYYGAMIDLGATTFWEDFDYDWLRGAKPIDKLLKTDEYDVHGDNGGWCYKGYRHSLCHGWAAGPVPFFSEYVLGVRLFFGKEQKIIVSPNLGNLTWAEGTVPTPHGNFSLKIVQKNGTIMVKHNQLPNVEIKVEEN